MNKKNDLCDLVSEISGVSSIISGLSNQIDSNESDSLRPVAMKMALLGLAAHLDRIADDLEDIDFSQIKMGVKDYE